MGAYQLIVVKWIQAVINFIVLIYAGNWMRKRLELQNILIFLILLFTVVFFFMHVQFSMLSILSEAIAFPLFILTFIFLVDSFIDLDMKKIILAVITCNLLILARDQFYYMYVMLFMLTVYAFLHKVPLKKSMVISAIVLFSVVFNILTTGIYHYAMNGRFGESSAVGEILLPPALYLATPDDAKYFEHPFHKMFFLSVEKSLYKNHLNYASVPKELRPPLQLIMSSAWYNIMFNPIKKTALRKLPPHTSSYVASRTLTEISAILYTHELMKNFKFYFWRTTSAIGGVWVFLGFLIVLFSALFRIISDRKYDLTINQAVTFLAISIALMNAGFVTLFSSFDARYYYYVYFLYAILACLVGKTFLQKPIENISHHH